MDFNYQFYKKKYFYNYMKWRLRELDVYNIIDIKRVNMSGRSSVDNYLNDLSLDEFLYILKNGNQFDKNEINKLLEAKNGLRKKHKKSQVYRRVIENPNLFKRRNNRRNNKNVSNKSRKNGELSGELRGELETIKISLSNTNTNFSKKVLREYRSILEYQERRLRNTKNNVLKKEKQDITDLLRIIKSIMLKKEKNNKYKKNKSNRAIQNFREKLNTLIDKMNESKRKYTTTIKQPSTITIAVLTNLKAKVKEAKKEANKPAIFGKYSKSVSDASYDVLREIEELLKNKSIPQSGGRKKYIINPLTGRKILKNGPTARKLNL